MITHSQTVVLPSFRLDWRRYLCRSRGYEMYGEMNDNASNVILVEHAFTGDAHAAGISDADGKARLVGPHDRPGRPSIPTALCHLFECPCGVAHYRTLHQPETGRPYAMSFPATTIGDMVRLQKSCSTL